MREEELKNTLDKYYKQFNRLDFIEADPISIPHRFSKKEDIEIMAFLVSTIAWGQRVSILNSGERLIQLFEGAPHQFITQHQEKDLKRCIGFVHRTFNDGDLLCFIAFLKEIYTGSNGLEFAFSKHLNKHSENVEAALNGFRKSFEASETFLKRSAKHVAYPLAGSACKRLNMFLRWMVRNDKQGVDFGLWKTIQPRQLICPLDVHVIAQALELKLIHEAKSNWKTALALTARLKAFDANDPVKYDFALFGLGIEKKALKSLK